MQLSTQSPPHGDDVLMGGDGQETNMSGDEK